MAEDNPAGLWNRHGFSKHGRMILQIPNIHVNTFSLHVNRPQIDLFRPVPRYPASPGESPVQSPQTTGYRLAPWGSHGQGPGIAGGLKVRNEGPPAAQEAFAQEDGWLAVRDSRKFQGHTPVLQGPERRLLRAPIPLERQDTGLRHGDHMARVRASRAGLKVRNEGPPAAQEAFAQEDGWLAVRDSRKFQGHTPVMQGPEATLASCTHATAGIGARSAREWPARRYFPKSTPHRPHPRHDTSPLVASGGPKSTPHRPHPRHPAAAHPVRDPPQTTQVPWLQPPARTLQTPSIPAKIPSQCCILECGRTLE